MLNYEKYMKELKNPNINLCRFAAEHILRKFGAICSEISCPVCQRLQSVWLTQEYEEPEVDWSKVEVDTPILVWDDEEQDKVHRHFAKYEDSVIFAWKDGMTSWSTETKIVWTYAELAEVSNE